MKITTKTTRDANKMRTITIKLKEIPENDLKVYIDVHLLHDRQNVLRNQPDFIDVTDEMKAAARRTFLSPERVQALGDTLSESYKAMERTRRSERS